MTLTIAIDTNAKTITVTSSGTMDDIYTDTSVAAASDIVLKTDIVGTFSRKIIYAPAYELKINGTMTHDHKIHECTFKQISGNASGSYTATCSITDNSQNTKAPFIGLTLLRRSSQHYIEPAIDASAMATWDMDGGGIKLFGGFTNFNTITTLSIKNSYIISMIASTNGTFPLSQMKNNSSIQDNTFINLGLWNNTAIPSTFTGNTIKSGLAFTIDKQVNNGGGIKTIQDVKLLGATNLMEILRGSRVKLLNSDVGGSANITFGDNSSTGEHTLSNVDSTVRISKKINVSLKDSSGNVNGGKIYIKDTNNNLRSTPQGETDTLTNDITYSQITDSTGKTTDFEVLTAYFYPKSPYSHTASDKVKKDFRDKTDSASAQFDIFIASYSHDLSSIINADLTGTGTKSFSAGLILDSNVSATKMVVDAYTSIDTSTKLYDAFKSYLVDNFAGETQTLITRLDNLIDLRALNLIFVREYSNTATYAVNDYVYNGNNIYKNTTAITTGEAFTASNWSSLNDKAFAKDGNNILVKMTSSEFTGSIKTTGTTTLNGKSVSGTIEDNLGVRVIITKSGGGNFNIVARSGTTGSYSDLGYSSNVSRVEYTVTKGTPVEIVMLAEGSVLFHRVIQTTDGGVFFDAEIANLSVVDTSIDVSSVLDDITTSLNSAGDLLTITFTDQVTVSGIEKGKTLFYRILGLENSLRLIFNIANNANVIEIINDEVKFDRPNIQLVLGSGITASERVYLDFFINQVSALAINSNYVLNPSNSDNNQVNILRAKPTLDANLLAEAVKEKISPDIEAGVQKIITTR